jgi:hypothetical protein
MRQLKIQIIGLPIKPQIKDLETQEALFSLIPLRCPHEPPKIIPNQSHEMLRVFNLTFDFLRNWQTHHLTILIPSKPVFLFHPKISTIRAII